MLHLGFAQHLFESSKVRGRIEKRPTRVGPVQNMVNHPARSGSPGSSHAVTVAGDDHESRKTVPDTPVFQSFNIRRQCLSGFPYLVGVRDTLYCPRNSSRNSSRIRDAYYFSWCIGKESSISSLLQEKKPSSQPRNFSIRPNLKVLRLEIAISLLDSTLPWLRQRNQFFAC